jgi:demethylmenaquinone methyltransferase / 2-methoxy-6-polyprenyl-1,4-benzoquinol methylase
MTVVPYKEHQASKKEQVAQMFDRISGRYDFLNHFLSLGIDVGWRKKAINLLTKSNPKVILDVATGTGDFAIQALALKPDRIIGVDISDGMLEVGRKKMKDRKVDHIIGLQLADSEKLPFPDNSFDAVTVAFGVRNFENMEAGLAEMLRVLRPGGAAVILEFSKPSRTPFRQFYSFYFNHILPKIGRWISNDKSAYTYLPQSVEAFPDGQKFIDILVRLGYKETSCKPLTFGISTLYSGSK